MLEATWTTPRRPRGVVLVVHGSVEIRRDRRARAVTADLAEAGFVTVLGGLLTVSEQRADERTGLLRSDTTLLAGRLAGALDWVCRQPDVVQLPVGVLGVVTGGAPALLATTYRPDLIRAVVCLDGRPDLAGSAVSRVEAPTLLIASDTDPSATAANRRALDLLPGPHELRLTAGATAALGATDATGATGATGKAVSWTTQWFTQHLRRPAGQPTARIIRP
jgi:dienelactone hydrolase